MKTSFHRLLTKDNLEIAGLLYEPESKTKKILVHVHGMAGNFYENKFIDFIVNTLTSNNIAVFVFNNRGCELVKDLIRIENGKRTFVRIGDSYEKFEESIFDIETAIDFVQSAGFSEIHLSGHSLGAPKIAYYASEQKDRRLKSVIFLSPSDMVGLAKADKNYKRDIDTARRMISEGNGKELMPFIVWGENFLSAETYLSIGSEDSKVAIFNFYDPNDPLPVLKRILVPALTIMGRKDAALTISIEDTMERIKKAMEGSSRVETCILGDANHGYNNYEQPLADTMNQWIQKSGNMQIKIYE